MAILNMDNIDPIQTLGPGKFYSLNQCNNKNWNETNVFHVVGWMEKTRVRLRTNVTIALDNPGAFFL